MYFYYPLCMFHMLYWCASKNNKTLKMWEEETIMHKSLQVQSQFCIVGWCPETQSKWGKSFLSLKTNLNRNLSKIQLKLFSFFSLNSVLSIMIKRLGFVSFFFSYSTTYRFSSCSPRGKKKKNLLNVSRLKTGGEKNLFDYLDLRNSPAGKSFPLYFFFQSQRTW